MSESSNASTTSQATLDVVPRAAFAELESKWSTAKSLLVEVNQQNKSLRTDLSKKTEQLKKLFDEYTAQKNTLAQQEDLFGQAKQRNAAHEDNVKRLEQMVEALGDASTGLHGEQELRMAELQRTNDRLMQESAHRDDECRELQKQVETMRSAAIEQRAQIELRDGNVAKLSQEKSFAHSQLQVERNRCGELAREVELLRARAVDAETRQRPRHGGAFADWWERVKADRTASLYFGVLGIVFLMLLWYFLASRRTYEPT